MPQAHFDAKPVKKSPPSEEFFFFGDLSISAQKDPLNLHIAKMVSSTALTSKVDSGSPYQLDTPQVSKIQTTKPLRNR